MANLKCKHCGAGLSGEVEQGVTQCPLCGSKETVPGAEGEALTLFARAGQLRAACDFVQAEDVYRQIVAAYPEEAEGYWGLVLCKYGVEYAGGQAVYHRCSPEGILEDPNFEMVLEYAHKAARRVYFSEAKHIAQALKAPETAAPAVDVQELVSQGYAALTGRAWARAADFFDQALAGDSRCAEAYLGKALIEFRVSSLNQAAAKYSVNGPVGQPEAIPAFQPDSNAEAELAREASEKGFPEADVLRAARKFDFTIPSQTRVTQAEGQRIQRMLGDNQNLTQADTLGSGLIRDQIAGCKAAIAASFETAVRQSRQADAARALELRRKYEAHMAQQRLLFGLSKALSKVAVVELVPTVVPEAPQQEVPGAEVVQETPVKKPQPEKQPKKKETPSGRKNPVALILAAVAVVALAAVLVVNLVIIPGNKYDDAFVQMANANYREAAAAFQELGGYKDSADKAAMCLELQAAEDARSMLEQKDFYQAKLALEELVDTARYDAAAELAQDLLDEIENDRFMSAYIEAEELLLEGKKAEAAMAFGSLGSYENAARRSRSLWKGIALWNPIAARQHTVAVKENGAVVATGYDNYNQCDVSDMEDVVAVAAGNCHTVALRADGTVMASGADDYDQCTIPRTWTDIVSIAAGSGHTVGLRSDGTVLAAGYNDHGQCDVSAWTNIIAISAENGHTVGLRADGTVVAVGLNKDDQCEVSGWRDIVAIDAGDWHTVGLRADGTLVATGYNGQGQCDVKGLTGIVAVSAGKWHTIALRSDGTVAALGDNSQDQSEVEEWTDIVAISAGLNYTVGLRSDGTLVAAGSDKSGQCSVSDWSGVMQPQK